MRMLRWFLACWLATWCAAALAQAAPDPTLSQRVQQLPAAMAGSIPYGDYFDPLFTSTIPETQFRQIAAQMTAANGAVGGVEGVTASGPFNATVRLGYARAVATVEIAVAPAFPNKVTGLRITGAEARDDSLEKLRADLAALPGRRALIVTEIGAAPLLAVNPDMPGALGSGFKLFVLAELARAVKAGERRWSHVVPLAPDVLSSPTAGRWPARTPITLQAAATAMIATSDNRATDTVIAALDPAKLEATVRALGIDPRSLPMLDTRTALAIKAEPGGAIARRWAAADIAGRRALLADRAAIETATRRVSEGAFNGAPLHIDSVEWFASPAAMAGLLSHLRDAGPEVAAILAVNPGAAPRDRFAWVGYKGGSEPGVIAMNYLVRTRTGRWFAVAGYWNDPAKPVQDLTFAALMSRALALVAAR